MGVHNKKSTNFVYFIVACLLLSLWASSSPVSGSTIGVNLGLFLGTNLPSSSEAVALLKANNIDKVKMFDAYDTVLQAFQGSNITLIVATFNEELQGISSSQANADQWVQNKIVPYASNIKYIEVGNEVIQIQTSFSPYLLPAMRNINNALVSKGLDGNIKVTTPVTFTALGISYPPSAGRFQTGIEDQMCGILQLINQTGSKFTANVYPFFTFKDQPSFGLNFSTFRTSQGFDDNGLHYSNLFDAQVDAFVSAMSALGYHDMPILIGESGWPTQGDQYASIENAKAHNNGLVAHVPNGSPKRPGVLIETYLFELFNEDKKPGDVVEHYWGVFDGQTKLYNMTF